MEKTPISHDAVSFRVTNSNDAKFVVTFNPVEKGGHEVTVYTQGLELLGKVTTKNAPGQEEAEKIAAKYIK